MDQEKDGIESLLLEARCPNFDQLCTLHFMMVGAPPPLATPEYNDWRLRYVAVPGPGPTLYEYSNWCLKNGFIEQMFSPMIRPPRR
jgi:hypothetical protein